MLGVLEPTDGEVRIGAQGATVPLQRLGLTRWRQMVGVVMQDEPLFSGSVADNISFFDSAPDAAWMSTARAWPRCTTRSGHADGLHTLIGELGTRCRAGRSSACCWRARCTSGPRILLLDEATSALDVERERTVNQAVRQLR
jgi:ATP-binding cassette subfamily B protein RaxB